MRLVAGVLHITGVASNCYAGDKMVCMQINTKTSKTGHTHDDRYYTESEINTKIAAINRLKPSLSPIIGYFSASDRITHITWDDKSKRIKVMIDRTTWVYIDVSY